MKPSLRILCGGLILAVFFLAGCAANSVVKGNIYKSANVEFKDASFAILPFTSASEGKTYTSRVATDGNAIADIISIQMLSKGYKVLERDKIDKIFKETALDQSGLVADSLSPNRTDVNVGRMLGVKYVMTGSVIQYEYEYAHSSWQLALGVTARIIDVETSKIVLIVTASKQGNNLAEALNDISMAISGSLKEDKIYVWQ
jgi:curli biogenesis system outer membrane secretion channel CsgG